MNHNMFFVMIVVIIVIFVLLLIGGFALSKENFTNPGMLPAKQNPFLNAKKTNSQFIDTSVPDNLGYSNITGYYNERMDDGLNGTSIVNVSSIDSGRFPIMIETPTNWYNTQGLLLRNADVGTDTGKLPSSDCFCNESSLHFS